MQELPRQLQFLKLLRRTKILTREMVQKELFPTSDSSTVRDFLRKTGAAGLSKKIEIKNQFVLQVKPYHIPTELGCVHLATELNDMSWLLDATPHFRVQDVPHAFGVSQLIIDLSKAVDAQQYVAMPGLYREQCVINASESDPAKRFRLYQVVCESPKRIVNIPDMATLFRVGKFTMAAYWEFETGSDGSPTRVAASKTPGYFWLNQSRKYREHFPEADRMATIAVCPGGAFRESLRRAVRDAKPLQGDDNGRDLWLFVDVKDLKPETMLHAPIYFTCAGDKPRSLIAPPVAAPAPPPAQELVGGGERGGA